MVRATATVCGDTMGAKGCGGEEGEGKRGGRCTAAHLVRLLGRLRVRLQQRRNHRLRRVPDRGAVQRQISVLRSAAASESEGKRAHVRREG